MPRPATPRERRLNRSLARAASAAARRYLALPGVVGVGPGLRTRNGVETGELAVQFLVDRKRRRPARPVPGFVYARERGGAVDRRVKFPTDVVAVGRPELACGGGAPLEANFESGTITLLFRNRAQRTRDAWYLLTCAHVVGELAASPPDEDALASPECFGAGTFARTLKNALPQRARLAFDIALARLTAEAQSTLGSRGLAALDGRVSDDGRRLTGFVARDELAPPLDVRCRLGASGDAAGRLTWGPGPLRAVLDGVELEIAAAYMSDVAARPGDSGGLVYRDDAAVGFVFARSAARQAWLQALEPAVAHVAALEPAFALEPFGPNPREEMP